MPGGQEPKAKKRKRVDRREKEKPLLAVQGLLKLDHCFVPPKNAEVRKRFSGGLVSTASPRPR